MATLEQLVEAARQVESVEAEIPGGDDPLAGLEELIRRARREEEGEGGAALRRLEERIEAARELPTPQAYRPAAGDPLEVLYARIRGEYDEEMNGDGGGDAEGGRDGEEGAPRPVRREAAPADDSRREQMGAALEASLRRRPLAGEVRAEVAARLAAMTEGASAEEVQQLWELVVFGDGDLGRKGQEG